ncbi:hypothetical protein G9A89_012412, partial [Geosiphon pyriformis]
SCPLLSTNQLWQQETQICHNYGKQGHIKADCHAYILNSESLLKLKSISIYLSVNDTTANLSNTSILTSNISTTAICNISITTTNKTQILSNPKLEIGDGGLLIDSQFIKSIIRIILVEFRNRNYLSLLITPEDAVFSKQKTNQKPLTCNIPPVASTENKLLATIFPFELEKITSVLLFSGAVLDTKPITTIYTDVKVNGQYIKLILDTASAKIITADGATKTLIGKIDDFSFKVNSIIIPIKVLVMEATQYQALVALIQPKWSTYMCTSHVWSLQDHQYTSITHQSHRLTITTMNYCQYFPEMTITIKKENKEKNIPGELPLTFGLTTAKDGQVHTLFASHYHSHHLFHLNAKTVERNSLSWKHGSHQMKTTGCEHIITANCAIANAMDIQSTKTSRTTNHVSLVVNSYSIKECGTTFLVKEEHVTLHASIQFSSVTG